jgi:IS30 family transposase
VVPIKAYEPERLRCRRQSRRIPNTVAINQRPEAVLDHLVSGHCEGISMARRGRGHLDTTLMLVGSLETVMVRRSRW